MTTIAITRDKIVSDSKVTMETKAQDRVYHAQKIWELANGDLMGAAGSNDCIEQFQKWYGTKKKRPKFPEGEFEALVLTTKGEILAFDETCARDRIKGDFYAIGSGGQAALGALYMGATIEQAVEIACKIDPSSGLPIQVLSIEKTPGTLTIVKDQNPLYVDQ